AQESESQRPAAPRADGRRVASLQRRHEASRSTARLKASPSFDWDGARAFQASGVRSYDRHSMIRPTVARIDLGALKSNYTHVVEYLARERSAPPPGVIAVVKANAYGHGAAQVARALEDAGADLLACADIEEGAVLRTAGVRADILVFGALSVSDLDGLFDCRLTPTISTPAAARAVQAAAARHKQRVRYHLKIDTG